MARWVWRLPGPLSPAWCPRFRKTGKSGKCQGRSCGDTETPHSQGRIRGSLAGKPGWEPITARFFSRGTQESLPSLLLNMQSSAEIILAKNTSHTPSPHRLSSLAGAAAVRVEALGLQSSLSPPASPGSRLYRARPGGVALPRLVALRCPFICLCGQVGTLELGLCGHFCVCSASDLLSKLVLMSRVSVSEFVPQRLG